MSVRIFAPFNALITVWLCANAMCSADEPLTLLDVKSQVTLEVPVTGTGMPSAGLRVKVTPAEYSGTDVYHTVYLPKTWKADGTPIPIIFEYTGNYFPASGSTGEVSDANLGYCLTGGQFIWVSLPYIKSGSRENEVTWWGDTEATLRYAETHVPQIIERFNADKRVVLLCGFSRGAIGVNYLGLHNDRIAALWTGFVTHDHYDGLREWRGTTWGAPLAQYRRDAVERLRRVGNRPYLVSHNGKGYGVVELVEETFGNQRQFEYLYTDTEAIFGRFPNRWAKSPHTDLWAVKPGKYRTTAWRWVNQVVAEAGRTELSP